MTSQLDDRPPQILTPAPEGNESPSRRRTWIVATAAVAGLALGAGLIVVGAAGSTEAPEEPERSAYQIIQNEIDKSLAAVASQAGEEPERSAYQMIQDEIDASLARRDSASDE